MNYNPEKNRVAKERIIKLNELKNQLVAKDKYFSKEELRKAMKEIGFSCNGNFWSALTNCHCTEYGAKLVTKIGRGKWVFTNPNKPICWKDLQEIHNLYTKITRDYNAKNRKQVLKEEPVKNIDKEHVSIKVDELLQIFRQMGAEVTLTITIK